jgi:hypothetical protein
MGACLWKPARLVVLDIKLKRSNESNAKLEQCARFAVSRCKVYDPGRPQLRLQSEADSLTFHASHTEGQTIIPDKSCSYGYYLLLATACFLCAF